MKNQHSRFGPFIKDDQENLFFQAREVLGPIFIVENDEQKQKLEKYYRVFRILSPLLLILFFIYIEFFTPLNKENASILILILLPFLMLDQYVLKRLSKTIKKLSFTQSMALLARRTPYFILISIVILLMIFVFSPIKHALIDFPPNILSVFILITIIPFFGLVFVRCAYIGVLKHYFNAEETPE